MVRKLSSTSAIKPTMFLFITFFLYICGVGNSFSGDDTAIKFYGSDQAIKDRIFGGDQAGMFLWPSTSKFCAHLGDNQDNTEKGGIKLLYSNESQTKFHTGYCRKGCSLSEETSAMRQCQSSFGGEPCKLYAAVDGLSIYDLTVSADGKKLSEICVGR